MQQFRLDRITSARLEASSFSRAKDFGLTTQAARAFGRFHDDHEYGEVVWRFLPEAAMVARDIIFRPEQLLTDGPDGSLTETFVAAEHLEMAWHLFQWGDMVEVVAPDALRDLVEGHRRSDFDGLP